MRHSWMRAVVVLVWLAGCAPLSVPPRPVPYRGALLKVDNRGSLDLDVFAYHTSDIAMYDLHVSPAAITRVHLGSVAADSRSEFVIPSEFIYSKASPVRFVIHEIHRKRAVVDEELIVTPVDTVSFTIPPL